MTRRTGTVAHHRGDVAAKTEPLRRRGVERNGGRRQRDGEQACTAVSRKRQRRRAARPALGC